MSGDRKVVIIAEIGENHIGDIAIAKKLIKEAARTGADYVKFQSYKPENFRNGDPEYHWFKKVSLSDQAHFILKEYAQRCKIKFLSSPFSLERARFLCEDLGLREIKVASGMMLNFGVLDYLNEHADTIFLSTGMASIQEIKKALTHLGKVKRCYILHCVTQYPCKDAEANLLAINTLREEFPDHKIGYSDHTAGYLASLLAVSLGATVIEKHFTFDKNAKEGTDHMLSLEANELADMVKSIGRINVMLGNGKKEPTEQEKRIAGFVRNRFI